MSFLNHVMLILIRYVHYFLNSVLIKNHSIFYYIYYTYSILNKSVILHDKKNKIICLNNHSYNNFIKRPNQYNIKYRR